MSNVGVEEMDDPSILIVEDEAVIALDIKQRLLQLGYQVVAIADSAETALSSTVQTKPDLVLMDIRLRGAMDGIETASYIREKFNLPVVFITAHVDEATLTQAKKIRPFGYIVKPFENHDLSTAIEIALSRHQAEISMQAALEKEKELHNLKSRFVAILSHEFRNPLSAVIFSLDLLSRQVNPLSAEKQQIYIHRAREAIERIEQLLEDILILEEVGIEQFPCHPLPIDLPYFCQDLIDEFQALAGSSYFIRTHIKEHEPGRSYEFDVKLLRHILSNLLSNAVKYSPKGGDIYFELVCTTTEVIFCIQDWGIGIPVDDQKRLFTSFCRGSNVSHIPGTGLGLSIVKQCVDAQNGRITVESNERVGTLFTVILPLKN